jgi:hypothetical protein
MARRRPCDFCTFQSTVCISQNVAVVANGTQTLVVQCAELAPSALAADRAHGFIEVLEVSEIAH